MDNGKTQPPPVASEAAKCGGEIEKEIGHKKEKERERERE